MRRRRGGRWQGGSRRRNGKRGLRNLSAAEQGSGRIQVGGVGRSGGLQVILMALGNLMPDALDGAGGRGEGVRRGCRKLGRIGRAGQIRHGRRNPFWRSGGNWLGGRRRRWRWRERRGRGGGPGAWRVGRRAACGAVLGRIGAVVIGASEHHRMAGWRGLWNRRRRFAEQGRKIERDARDAERAEG